jgi:hypothetical protein
MANISTRNQVRLVLDEGDVKRLEKALRKFGKRTDTKTAERQIDKALTYAVKPWQEQFNKGQAYKYVEWQTGASESPMGNKKVKGLRKKVYGRKVSPKMKGKSSGWRIHFFARPARQISKKKRIPFYRLFAAKTPEVIARANSELSILFQNLANKSFKG